MVVDKGSGRVTVKRVVAAFDVGQMINPDGVRNQMEGGIIQALSRALVEEVTYGDNTITSVDWAKHPIHNFMDLPDIDIMLLDRPAERPGGAGETQTPDHPRGNCQRHLRRGGGAGAGDSLHAAADKGLAVSAPLAVCGDPA